MKIEQHIYGGQVPIIQAKQFAAKHRGRLTPTPERIETTKKGSTIDEVRDRRIYAHIGSLEGTLKDISIDEQFIESILIEYVEIARRKLEQKGKEITESLANRDGDIFSDDHHIQEFEALQEEAHRRELSKTQFKSLVTKPEELKASILSVLWEVIAESKDGRGIFVFKPNEDTKREVLSPDTSEFLVAFEQSEPLSIYNLQDLLELLLQNQNKFDPEKRLIRALLLNQGTELALFELGLQDRCLAHIFAEGVERLVSLDARFAPEAITDFFQESPLDRLILRQLLNKDVRRPRSKTTISPPPISSPAESEKKKSSSIDPVHIEPIRLELEPESESFSKPIHFPIEFRTLLRIKVDDSQKQELRVVKQEKSLTYRYPNPIPKPQHKKTDTGKLFSELVEDIFRSASELDRVVVKAYFEYYRKHDVPPNENYLRNIVREYTGAKTARTRKAVKHFEYLEAQSIRITAYKYRNKLSGKSHDGYTRPRRTVVLSHIEREEEEARQTIRSYEHSPYTQPQARNFSDILEIIDKRLVGNGFAPLVVLESPSNSPCNIFRACKDLESNSYPVNLDSLQKILRNQFQNKYALANAILSKKNQRDFEKITIFYPAFELLIDTLKREAEEFVDKTKVSLFPSRFFPATSVPLLQLLPFMYVKLSSLLEGEREKHIESAKMLLVDFLQTGNFALEKDTDNVEKYCEIARRYLEEETGVEGIELLDAIGCNKLELATGYFYYLEKENVSSGKSVKLSSIYNQLIKIPAFHKLTKASVIQALDKLNEIVEDTIFLTDITGPIDEIDEELIKKYESHEQYPIKTYAEFLHRVTGSDEELIVRLERKLNLSETEWRIKRAYRELLKKRETVTIESLSDQLKEKHRIELANEELSSKIANINRAFPNSQINFHTTSIATEDEEPTYQIIRLYSPQIEEFSPYFQAEGYAEYELPSRNDVARIYKNLGSRQRTEFYDSFKCIMSKQNIYVEVYYSDDTCTPMLVTRQEYRNLYETWKQPSEEVSEETLALA